MRLPRLALVATSLAIVVVLCMLSATAAMAVGALTLFAVAVDVHVHRDPPHAAAPAETMTVIRAKRGASREAARSMTVDLTRRATRR